MKIKIIKIFSCLLVMCICLLAFQIKPKAQSSNTIFEPFEVGMTFPSGYELTIDNLESNFDTKTYVFFTSIEEVTFTQKIYYTNENGFFEYDDDYGVGEFVGDSVKIGYAYENGIPTQIGDAWEFLEWELISIVDSTGVGELGVYVENVDDANAIYGGTYELLVNLMYGTTENLTPTQIGTLEFISMLITIMCVLLPFIILFFVIRKLVD